MSSPSLRKPGELIFALLLVIFSVFVFWQAYKIAGLSSMSSWGLPYGCVFRNVVIILLYFCENAKNP